MYVIISTVNFVLTVLYFVLFTRIILSWFPSAKNSQIANIIFMLTEPILAPIRKLLQRLLSRRDGGMGMMFDFSPLVAILLVQVVRSFVFNQFVI